MAKQIEQSIRPQRTSIQRSRAQPQAAQPRTTTVAPQPGEDIRTALTHPRQASPAQLLALQRRYGNRAVQRMLNGSAPGSGPALDEQSRGLVAGSGQPASAQGGTLDAQTQSQIERARGSGSALDAGVGAQVGSALGADFSGVTVHTDRNAAVLNRSLSARAFTTGSDIFFSRGAYQPHTSAGKQLLAHELAHVVQQSSAKPNKASRAHDQRVQTKAIAALPASARLAARVNRPQPKLTVGAANDRYEQEADRMAARVMSHTAAPGAVHRLDDAAAVQTKALLRPARSGLIQRAWWNPRSWGKQKEPAAPPAGLQTTPGYAPEDDAEEQAVAKAFKAETFYYGTTGGNSKLKDFIKKIHKPKLERAYAQAKALTPPKDAREESGLKSQAESNMYYWPGERAGAYLEGRSMAGQPGANMMDNYYGNENLDMHKARNPAIGKYVHKAMGYAGDYDHEMPGETAYKNTYGPTAGWDPKGKLFNAQPAPQVSSNWRGKRSLKQPGGVKTYRSWAGTWTGISGTMEISRQIRNGVQKYGGRIVFEGSTVPWNGSFVPGLIQGDTNVEAEYMMPYFALKPGQRTVPFGKGQMTFHWKGKPTVPTRGRFRTKWNFDDSKNPAQENVKQRKVGDDAVSTSNLYWKFPEQGYDAQPRPGAKGKR